MFTLYNISFSTYYKSNIRVWKWSSLSLLLSLKYGSDMYFTVKFFESEDIESAIKYWLVRILTFKTTLFV